MIKDLKIPQTIDTPAIDFSPESNKLEITGKSYPENTHDFYLPVLQWVKDYVATHPSEVIFNMKLIYFSSSSYKPLLDIFLLLESLKQNQAQVSINWFYKKGDIDMEEAGREFEDLVELPFSFRTY